MAGKVKIGVSDFWPGADLDRLRIHQILRRHFDIEISDRPDYLIYSDYSGRHLDHDCVKIHYSPENIRSDFSLADFCIGFDYCPDVRYLRYPLYVEYRDDVHNEAFLERPISDDEVRRILARKTKLCCFIVSNGNGAFRNEFFHKLNARARVDSGGAFENNIGYRVGDKVEFMKDYKFVIAFENSAHPGYTTEKVMHPFYSRAIPIYWGNPKVDDELNPNSFIWVRGPEDVDAAIERVLSLDSDDEAYVRLLRVGPFYERRRNLYYSEQRIVSFFERVFECRRTAVTAQARQKARLQRSWARNYDRARRRLGRLVARGTTG